MSQHWVTNAGLTKGLLPIALGKAGFILPPSETENAPSFFKNIISAPSDSSKVHLVPSPFSARDQT
jgi:hypothetical protein